jgi:hypothetical protein
VHEGALDRSLQQPLELAAGLQDRVDVDAVLDQAMAPSPLTSGIRPGSTTAAASFELFRDEQHVDVDFSHTTS